MARGRKDADGRPLLDKSAFEYEIMIRQPDFVTSGFAAQVLDRAAVSMVHREIYLSDPRRVAPDKQRTVLRVQVRTVG